MQAVCAGHIFIIALIIETRAGEMASGLAA